MSKEDLTGPFRLRYSVTCFLQSERGILVLRRSERVSTYRGRWGGISGTIDEGSTPDEQALREIEEEAGLSQQEVTLVRKSQPLVFDDEALRVRKVVYPYLFRVRDATRVRTDWEHSEMRWIAPDDVASLNTMPMLREMLEQILNL